MGGVRKSPKNDWRNKGMVQNKTTNWHCNILGNSSQWKNSGKGCFINPDRAGGMSENSGQGRPVAKWWS